MSNRRKAGVTNRTVAYIAAGLIHAGILAAMLINYTSDNPETIKAHEAEKVDTINASLINEKDIKDQQAKMTKLEKERQRKKREAEKRERDKLADIKKQADDQQKKLDTLKEEEKLENKRKEIALKKKKAEDERKKKAAAEKKRLAEIEKKRVEKEKETKRLKREEEDLRERQRLNALLADEEAEQKRRAAEQIAKERTAKITSLYLSRIRESIDKFRREPPGTGSLNRARVNIKLSPRGDVISVRIIESSGLDTFDQSIKNAILQASPLPIPSSEEDAQAHIMMQDIYSNFAPNN